MWSKTSASTYDNIKIDVNYIYDFFDKEEYEKNLKEIQRKHLEQVDNNQDIPWQPCLHDSCPYCHGTGVKLNGSPCIHHISCNCPKCSAWNI